MIKDNLEKMTQMRLLGMHQAYKTSLEANQSLQNFTNDELVEHLVVSEWDDRRHRAVQRGLKNANFRYNASIEQLDYSGDRGLDKNIVQRLATCDFIKKGEDLFITGSTGTGKSFLASALGQQACLAGYKVLNQHCFAMSRPLNLHYLNVLKFYIMEQKKRFLFMQ